MVQLVWVTDQINPYTNATGSWRSSNAQELRAEENSTFNSNYTAISPGSSPAKSLDLVRKKYFLEI